MAAYKVSRKTKELFAAVLLLNVAAIGWYAFLFFEVKAKNEHISVLVNEIEAKTAQEDVHNSIKTVASETALQREKLKKYVVQKEGTVAFIELLENTGKGIGVDVSTDSVSERGLSGNASFGYLVLSLKATGTWSGVVRFLGMMEFLPYEVHVEETSVSKENKQTGEWSLHVSLAVLKEK